MNSNTHGYGVFSKQQQWVLFAFSYSYVFIRSKASILTPLVDYLYPPIGTVFGRPNTCLDNLNEDQFFSGDSNFDYIDRFILSQSTPAPGYLYLSGRIQYPGIKRRNWIYNFGTYNYLFTVTRTDVVEPTVMMSMMFLDKINLYTIYQDMLSTYPTLLGANVWSVIVSDQTLPARLSASE